MAVLFALLAMVCFAADNFFVTKGLMRTPNPIIATFITLSVNMSFFLAYALSTGVLSEVRLSRIYLFVISGLMAPGLARVFSYKGLQTVGMSIAAPIINGEILFAVGLAVIFLKEPLEPEIVAGVVSVVAGLVILGYESGRKYPGSVSVTVRYRYLVYPLLASFCYGTSLFVRKLGLNVWGSPILGVLFTGGTSWVIIACTIVSSKNYTRFREVRRGSLLYFLMAGCSTCIAWYSLFHALHLERVSIVTPIATSYSLLTLVLSQLFLRDVERITRHVVVATVLVVGGIAALCLGK
jgi:bacterial/archaeal transporter family protein